MLLPLRPTLYRDLLGVSTVAGALAYGVVALAAAEVVRRSLRAGVRRMLARDVRGVIDRTAAAFVLQLAEIGVFVAAGIVYAHLVPALHHVGTALLAGVSVASVVIALAGQNTLGNLISGLSLLLYRPFRMDDMLEISTPAGPLAGIVRHVNLGYTLLCAEDGREIIVPNSLMASQVTVNLNGGGQRALAQVAFLVPDGDPLAAGRRALLEAAGTQPGLLHVLGCPVLAVGGGHVALTVRAWCADAATARRAEADLRLRGAAALRAAGVVVWSTTPAAVGPGVGPQRVTA